MNPVAQFESFIERLMERVFTRATHSHLQPVEIGKRLVRAMEADQQVGMDGVLVPNVYEVYLSPEDYAHFEPARRSLAQNMEAHLARTARQKQFHMVSRPKVTLHSERQVSLGDIQVAASLRDVEEPNPLESQHTSVLPALDDLGLPQFERPSLVLDGHTYAILHSPTSVGRSPDNDIVVNDPRVSRHHADIAQRGNRWMLQDAGSKNGTLVNGKMVKEAPLKPGDAISLGGVEATWEQ